MKKITIISSLLLLLSTTNIFSQNDAILDKLVKEAGENIYLKDFQFELKPGEEKQFFPIYLNKRTLYEWYADLKNGLIKVSLFDKFGNTIFMSKDTDQGIISFSVKSNKDSKYILNVKNLTMEKVQSTILVTTKKKLKEHETLVSDPLLDKLLNASNDKYLKDFDIELDSEEVAKHSLVLSKNTAYSISTYLEAPDQFDVLLIREKTAKTLSPKTEIVNSESLYQVYQILNTGIYHLIVKNKTDKRAETISVICFHERFYPSSKAEQSSPDPESIKEEKSYYFVVDEMPKFRGDRSDEFRNYMQQELKYPAEASEKNIHGRVFVSFVVGKDGYVKDASIVRGVHPSIDQETLRVVYSSPKWKPGIKDGKPVDVMFTFPVVFKLPK